MFLSSTESMYLPTHNNCLLSCLILCNWLWHSVFINSIFWLMSNAFCTPHVTINQHCYGLHWQLFQYSCPLYILLVRIVQSRRLIDFIVLKSSLFYSFVCIVYIYIYIYIYIYKASALENDTNLIFPNVFFLMYV